MLKSLFTAFVVNDSYVNITPLGNPVVHSYTLMMLNHLASSTDSNGR